MESFSLAVMEAWLAVLLSSRWRQARSWPGIASVPGGGLCYSDRAGLVRDLRLLQSEERAAEMAAAGRRYVIENYTWPAVLDRMEASLGATFGNKSGATGAAGKAA